MTSSTSSATNPYIGIKPALLSSATAISNTSLIENLVQSGYDFVLTPITNIQYREKSRKLFQVAKSNNQLTIPSPTLHDVNLFDGEYLRCTIGLLSSWIELESDDEQISEFSRQILINEIEYAKFIGLKHIIIAPPKDLIKLSNYSKVLRSALSLTESHQITISISLPVCENVLPENINSVDCLSTWDMWNSVRTSCDYNERLKVSLALPKTHIPVWVMDRWFAEPVSVLLISSSVFLINNKGYPVLSKQNQQFLTTFSTKRPIHLLHGLEKIPESIDPSSYMHYINYLITKNHKELTKIQKFAFNHHDVLQLPLQPLRNDLDNFTYNVFEEDTVKYRLYEAAIERALIDMSPLASINIAVVGAGKGGLVDAVLNAIQKLHIESKCNITAVEKNRSAMIFLQTKNQSKWEDTVELINTDMRDWCPRESQNLIISELLGSFGCNELAPECLKPLEKYLDRAHGVFIPQSCISYVAPVFTPRLHKTLKDLDQEHSFEKQYVVRLSESCLVSTKINQVWSFEHPCPHQKSRKNVISTFKIRHKAVIHGIAGFFSAKLYGDITISIKPDTHTQDLISWFPLFFPLETPMYVTDDTELEISLSRESRNNKVWYTWGLETFMYLVGPESDERQLRVRTGITKIHNHDGRAFQIDELVDR